jgi:hypothetical protein
MGNGDKATRENRTITVDFRNESADFQLIDDAKAFVEFVLAFILALGFQLTHKATCQGGGDLTRHALNKLPDKLIGVSASVCQGLRSTFHALLHRWRQRKNLLIHPR